MEGREQEMKVQKSLKKHKHSKMGKESKRKKTNLLGSHKRTNLVVYWVPKGL